MIIERAEYGVCGDLVISPPEAGMSQWVLLATEWTTDWCDIPVPWGPTHLIRDEASSVVRERPDFSAVLRENNWCPAVYVLLRGDAQR